jgi:ABC-2 type transport system ATP-binding protein
LIELEGLTKRYGTKTAVNGLTLTIEPGHVTGFLGPNGAGKSTTMRLIMGLDRPTQGHATIDGREYTAYRAPLTKVGALLDAKAEHPGRTARAHLRILAATEGLGKRRVDEVIELTGLAPVAGKRVGTFSLGMAQRLGLATALLGDPETLLLDEPVNGLDPEGVVWVRQLAKSLAREGRTVLISSHLMSEMALTADRVIVLGQGRLLANQPISELVAQHSQQAVRVRSPQAGQVAAGLAADGVTIKAVDGETLEITGLDAAAVGTAAARNAWVLFEITPIQASLESAYLDLTENAIEYRSTQPATSTVGGNR